MKKRIIALFVILTSICILAGCNNKTENEKVSNINTFEESQHSELNSDIDAINPNRETSTKLDFLDNEDYITDKQIELLEYAIEKLWDRSDDSQNVISQDIGDDELSEWIYIFFLNNYFYEFLDISFKEVDSSCSFVVENSDIIRITNDFLGRDVSNLDVKGNGGSYYHDIENDKWYLPIAYGEPQPSAFICDIKYNDMYLTITGYIRNGYCEEYSYTYDPLYKFVAEAVINPVSIFGCTLESIRYGNEDYIESFEASSELTDAYGTYYGKNILDNDYKTAWVPDNKGNAVGEYIVVNLDKERILYGFAIANGYFKSSSTYENNGKSRRIKLEFDNEEIEYDLTIPNVFEDLDYLIDTTAYSDIFYFDESVVTTRVKMILMETEPGMKYNDICITDIQLLY